MARVALVGSLRFSARSSAWSFALGLSLASVSVVGHAQEADAESSPAAAPADAPAIESARGARQVAPAKFVDTADSYLVGMRDIMSQGVEALSSARAEMDAIRLQCVSEKVTAMKGVLRISEDAYISLQEAMATRATDRARYEFSKIRTSQNKMQDLIQAVRSCVGSQSSTLGSGKPTFEVAPEIAVADPYYGSSDLFFSPDSALASTTQENSVGGEDSSSGGGSTSNIITRPPVVSGY